MSRERYYSRDNTIMATIEGKDSIDGEKLLFTVNYGGGDFQFESHAITLYEWAKHLHGNAPSGTPYGYIRASRNGKRIIITV